MAREYFADVSLSSDIGGLGLLERENAVIVNASLRPLARRTVKAFEAALQQLSVAAPLFITQNDGTLMSASRAAQYPVLTFNSGATNSMRGAAYLSGLKDAVVMDIGGTSTDVGQLADGFAVESSADIELSGGVLINFRMPDVHCFNLGGGTVVTRDDGDGTVYGACGRCDMAHVWRCPPASSPPARRLSNPRLNFSTPLIPFPPLPFPLRSLIHSSQSARSR